MSAGPQRMEFLTHVLAVVAGLALYWFGVVEGIRIPIIADALYGFHIVGDLAAFWLPPAYAAMAGSLVQLLVPLALAGYFLLFHRDYRGVSLMCALAAYSAHQVSTFIADAPYELVSIGPGHRLFDWAIALGPAGLDRLYAADELAWMVRVIAILAMLGGIGFGAWGAVRVLVERENVERLDAYLQQSDAQVRDAARATQSAELWEHDGKASD